MRGAAGHSCTRLVQRRPERCRQRGGAPRRGGSGPLETWTALGGVRLSISPCGHGLSSGNARGQEDAGAHGSRERCHLACGEPSVVHLHAASHRLASSGGATVRSVRQAERMLLSRFRRYSMKRWAKRIAITLASLLGLAILFGAGAEAVMRRRAARQYPAPGRLVDI